MEPTRTPPHGKTRAQRRLESYSPRSPTEEEIEGRLKAAESARQARLERRAARSREHVDRVMEAAERVKVRNFAPTGECLALKAPLVCRQWRRSRRRVSVAPWSSAWPPPTLDASSGWSRSANASRLTFPRSRMPSKAHGRPSSGSESRRDVHWSSLCEPRKIGAHGSNSRWSGAPVSTWNASNVCATRRCVLVRSNGANSTFDSRRRFAVPPADVTPAMSAFVSALQLHMHV